MDHTVYKSVTFPYSLDRLIGWNISALTVSIILEDQNKFFVPRKFLMKTSSELATLFRASPGGKWVLQKVWSVVSGPGSSLPSFLSLLFRELFFYPHISSIFSLLYYLEVQDFFFILFLFSEHLIHKFLLQSIWRERYNISTFSS